MDLAQHEAMLGQLKSLGPALILVCSVSACGGEDGGAGATAGMPAPVAGAPSPTPQPPSSRSDTGAPATGIGVDTEDTSGGPPPLQGEGDHFPCDVGSALINHCGECHGPTPSAGAPMSLATPQDFLAPAVSDPSRRVHALVAERMHDTARPMPPSGPLSGAELELLDGWLAAGVPATDQRCDDPGTTPDSGATADWAPDCETTHRIRAHARGDTAAEYHVTPDQTDAYICWHFDLPYAGDVQGLQFRSVIDEAPVVHHWLLYGTEQLPSPAGTVGPCAGVGASAPLITGWAPGREDLTMPADVGLELPTGDDAGLILQIHYYANGMDVRDGSGVDFCTTGTHREHTASISWLGTTAIDVGSGEVGTARGSCRPMSQEPIHILRTWPHMHLYGTHMGLTLHRQGGGSESMLDQAFNFDFQTSYETPVTLNPGDWIETVCSYENTGDEAAGFGEGTTDEMCFAFVYAYPAGALRGGAFNAERNYCIGVF